MADARRLTKDIIAPGGAMAGVADLLNVYAVFVPSYQVRPFILWLKVEVC